jgi:hypothetical protein
MRWWRWCAAPDGRGMQTGYRAASGAVLQSATELTMYRCRTPASPCILRSWLADVHSPPGCWLCTARGQSHRMYAETSGGHARHIKNIVEALMPQPAPRLASHRRSAGESAAVQVLEEHWCVNNQKRPASARAPYRGVQSTSATRARQGKGSRPVACRYRASKTARTASNSCIRSESCQDKQEAYLVSLAFTREACCIPPSCFRGPETSELCRALGCPDGRARGRVVRSAIHTSRSGIWLSSTSEH